MENKIKIDFDKTFKNYSSNDELGFKKNNLENFIKKGLPGRKLESWKFSDLNQIINKNIGELNFYIDPSKENLIDNALIVKDFDHNKIVFINGKVEELDFSFEDKDKVKILKEFDTSTKIKSKNSLLNLNNAFCKNFYKINISKNYTMHKPLIIYHVSTNNISSTTLNSQLNFILEENSSLKIVDIYEDKSEKNFINI